MAVSTISYDTTDKKTGYWDGTRALGEVAYWATVESVGSVSYTHLDGQFQAPFSPLKWGDAFTEGNSWHYSWSVFHDPQ